MQTWQRETCLAALRAMFYFVKVQLLVSTDNGSNLKFDGTNCKGLTADAADLFLASVMSRVCIAVPFWQTVDLDVWQLVLGIVLSRLVHVTSIGCECVY